MAIEEQKELESTDATNSFVANKDGELKNYNDLSFDGVTIKGRRLVDDENFYVAPDASEDSPLSFFPFYKVTDYTTDLNNFRKQINPFGQKGCFYFKIFFNFDSGYGLLGYQNSPNTALHYLNNIENLSMYKSEQISDRINALAKFKNILKTLSIDTPWFFKEVSNLNNLNDLFVHEDEFGAESYINIHCNYEATDMRLGTLFNLYKFICYNSLRNKEILPPNLRKFDMTILFMHVPLKNYHMGFDYYGTAFDDKALSFSSNNDMRNIMSVKMLTFQNCEFDVKSMNEMTDSVSNETMFELGNNVLKINYGRVYEHRINEFEQFGFGPDGFIFDLSNEDNPRLGSIANLVAKQIELHNPIPDDSEALSKHLGTDYYNEKIKKLHKKTFNPANIYSNFTNIRSHYFISKMKNMKNGNVYRGNLFGLFDIGKMDGANEHRAASQYNLYKKKTEIFAERHAIDPIQNNLGYISSQKNLLDKVDKITYDLSTSSYHTAEYGISYNFSYKVSSIDDKLNTVSQQTAEYGLSYGFNNKVSNIQAKLNTVSEKTAEYGISYNISDKISELDMKLNKNPEAGFDYGFSYDLGEQVKDIKESLAKKSEFGSDSGNSYFLNDTLDNIEKLKTNKPKIGDDTEVSAKQLGTDYYDDKIDKSKNNKPKIGMGDDISAKQLGSEYYDTKIDELKNNHLSMELLSKDDKELYLNSEETSNKKLGTQYYDDKIEKMKSTKYENMYGYFYGRVGNIIENRINSYYLTDKMRKLKKGKK